MADFAEYGEIIARCIGYKENEFIEYYFDNIEIQNEEVIDSSVVANVLIDFMDNKDEWEGATTILHKTLSDFIEDMEPSLIKNKLWPNAPNSLSRKINELRPTLKEKGIDIQHYYDNKRKGRQIKIIDLRKISSLSSYHSSCNSDDECNSEYDGKNAVRDKENTLYSFDTNTENQENKDKLQDGNNQSLPIVNSYIDSQKRDDVKNTSMPTIIAVTPIAEGNFQSKVADRYQYSRFLA